MFRWYDHLGAQLEVLMRAVTVVLFLAAFLVSAIASPAFADDTKQADTVKVKGYTRKDGKQVPGYERKVTKKKDAALDMAEVKNYTKKDGTVVKGYTRKKTGKASSK